MRTSAGFVNRQASGAPNPGPRFVVERSDRPIDVEVLHSVGVLSMGNERGSLRSLPGLIAGSSGWHVHACRQSILLSMEEAS